MIRTMFRIGLALIALLAICAWSSNAQEEKKASWLTPQKIIFLDETEVIGKRARPTSSFDADHIAKTIRPFTIHKDTRAILEHYEPRAELKTRREPFYDSRMDRRNW